MLAEAGDRSTILQQLNSLADSSTAESPSLASEYQIYNYITSWVLPIIAANVVKPAFVEEKTDRLADITTKDVEAFISLERAVFPLDLAASYLVKAHVAYLESLFSEQANDSALVQRLLKAKPFDKERLTGSLIEIGNNDRKTHLDLGSRTQFSAKRSAILAHTPNLNTAEGLDQMEQMLRVNDKFFRGLMSIPLEYLRDVAAVMIEHPEDFAETTNYNPDTGIITLKENSVLETVRRLSKPQAQAETIELLERLKVEQVEFMENFRIKIQMLREQDAITEFEAGYYSSFEEGVVAILFNHIATLDYQKVGLTQADICKGIRFVFMVARQSYFPRAQGEKRSPLPHLITDMLSDDLMQAFTGMDHLQWREIANQENLSDYELKRRKYFALKSKPVNFAGELMKPMRCPVDHSSPLLNGGRPIDYLDEALIKTIRLVYSENFG